MSDELSDELANAYADLSEALNGLESAGQVMIRLRERAEKAEAALATAQRTIRDWEIAASMEAMRAAEARALAMEEAARMLETEGTGAVPLDAAAIRALGPLAPSLVAIPRKVVRQGIVALSEFHGSTEDRRNEPDCPSCILLAALEGAMK